LARGEAVLVLAAEGHEPGEDIAALRAAEERRRRRFPSRLHRAADAYLVRRGNGKTIVAGYPWFTDWGRDTFIALRGLCLATGRLDDAGAIVREWAGTVSEGMVPNRFVDAGDHAEFNAVDSSLWFVIAASEYLEAMRLARRIDDRWEAVRESAERSFDARFWNPETGALFDVVDVDHEPGAVDPAIRPNMLFAVGGLPFALIDGERARSVVDVAERR